VSPELIARTRQPLSGWMGHKTPFDFDFDYEPAAAIRRFVCGTPQILSLAALDAALELWAEVDLSQLHRKSRDLTAFFIELVEHSCASFGVTVQSPRDAQRRGSHVAFGYGNGLQVMRALAARGIIGDFRTPDTMRFGVAPLYVGYADVVRAVEALHDVLRTGGWDRAEFRGTAVVT
jgi:kynureninase